MERERINLSVIGVKMWPKIRWAIGSCVRRRIASKIFRIELPKRKRINEDSTGLLKNPG
jgi:hypothetical protein